MGWMQLAEDEVQLDFFEQVNEPSGSLKIGKSLTGSLTLASEERASIMLLLLL